MNNKSNSWLRRIPRFLTILLILGLVWAGFLWLTQSPPVDAIPAVLMVWTTAIILLLALFPSILSNIGRFRFGEVEFEMRDSIKSANIQDFLSFADFSNAYRATSQGNARGFQAILAQALETPDKPVLLVVDLQEQKITLAFLFAFLMLMDLLSEQVLVVFAVPRKKIEEPENLNIGDILGAISGKKMLRAYFRRFPSLMNIFVREQSVHSVLESNGLVQIPSSELILALYEQCRTQISSDLENEKKRYLEQDVSSLDEHLSPQEIEKWLKEMLSQHIIDERFQLADIGTIYQALEEKDDYVIVAEDRRFKSVLVLEDFNRAVTMKTLSSIPGTV
jgi:hypothetical protein